MSVGELNSIGKHLITAFNFYLKKTGFKMQRKMKDFKKEICLTASSKVVEKWG